jgi:hypothetical protein
VTWICAPNLTATTPQLHYNRVHARNMLYFLVKPIISDLLKFDNNKIARGYLFLSITEKTFISQN